MSDEYAIEEVLPVDDFAKFIYDWYVERRIFQHNHTRADFVRGHNRRTKQIFDDLNELYFLLREHKINEASSHYKWLDKAVKELAPLPIVEYIEKHKKELLPVEEANEF